MTGSNRRPPACKAGALPAELIPQSYSAQRVSAQPLQLATADKAMVGLDGFEPSTPALSRRCSNRLSYRPLSLSLQTTADKCERSTLNAKLWKGGDPAAPSDTATLLRLHPSHESYRGDRPPCG